MTTRIMIDQCRSADDRVSNATEEEIEALAVSIRDSGMKYPILVQGNDIEGYAIIDGLARTLAASKLGHATIEALVAENLDQACKLLEKVNAKRTLHVRRQWEISVALNQFLRFHGRSHSQTRYADRDANRETGLQVIARAVGILNQGQMKLLRSTFSGALKAGEEGLELLRRLDKGELTVNQVRLRTALLGSRNVTRELVGAVEQHKLLLAVARSLRTTVKAGANVALPVEVSQEDLNEVINDLRKARAELARLIHTLEKEVKDE